MEQLGFDFGTEPKRLPRVTPARLATFDDCPRRYRLTYLDRPSPQRTGPWAHTTLGAAVHTALKALFDLPAPRRTPERAAALVREHWQDAGFADRDQATHYADRARRWVADYVEQHDVSGDPVGLERWVSAAVGPGGGPASLIVEGRADRIDARDGELVVVDYKTGRRVPGEDEALGSRALALYAVAAARTLRAPCHRVELHHLPTGTIAAADHTPASLDRHLEHAEETAVRARVATDRLAEGGDADHVFPARPARRCAWCAVRPACAEGQRAAPAARPWDLLAPTT